MIDSPLIGLLVLALVAAAPLLLRRVKAGQPGGVRVLGRTALHRNAVVAVVEVGNRRLLVGAGEKGIEVLTELEPDVADAATGPVAEDPAAPGIVLSAHTDAAPTDLCSTAATEEALTALLGPAGSTVEHAGPGIGLVDRLRHLTVRVSQPQRGAGRPLRATLRR
ncbi:flagellar biosynthetic protein FliO [Egicoccus sp. AB-alg6-2]|uniref:flagellar biosynthetic protein FliO n=1 Tax=Egicoccus sp. AB-alg6-2 TaxID=3242692 RepID=UPI00359EE5CC